MKGHSHEMYLNICAFIVFKFESCFYGVGGLDIYMYEIKASSFFCSLYFRG